MNVIKSSIKVEVGIVFNGDVEINHNIARVEFFERRTSYEYHS